MQPQGQPESETLDNNDPRIDDIHFTQGGIVRSKEVGDLDEFNTYVNTDWVVWADQLGRQWDDMVRELPTLRETYEAYWRGGYEGPMSFYVAEGGDWAERKLMVLLRAGRSGDRRRAGGEAPPSVLWTWPQTTPQRSMRATEGRGVRRCGRLRLLSPSGAPLDAAPQHPVGGTRQRQIPEQAGAQSVEALIRGRLDPGKGYVRMGRVPVSHPVHNRLALADQFGEDAIDIHDEESFGSCRKTLWDTLRR
ncbi:hypothetical protein, partial [Nitrolancea hollandica]|uniref:hypothetical protein n=1 Tax=Nitrolancea hollandica TaxID=1206749 RepID=UPI00058D1B9F